RRALLDSVPRVLVGGRGSGAALAPGCPRSDAAARLRLRVPELHRPRPRVVGARVLRDEPPAPRNGEEALRPRLLLPLRAGDSTCVSEMDPGGLEPPTFWLPARRSPS